MRTANMVISTGNPTRIKKDQPGSNISTRGWNKAAEPKTPTAIDRTPANLKRKTRRLPLGESMRELMRRPERICFENQSVNFLTYLDQRTQAMINNDTKPTIGYIIYGFRSVRIVITYT